MQKRLTCALLALMFTAAARAETRFTLKVQAVHGRLGRERREIQDGPRDEGERAASVPAAGDGVPLDDRIATYFPAPAATPSRSIVF
jgi:hypothetical protein